MIMNKKPKLLYIAPDHYGFYKVLLKAFKEYSNYEVDFLCSNKMPPYEYKNVFERILNFFSKNILGYNIKKHKRKLEFDKKINELNDYDKLFINRPDILNNVQLDIITSKCKINIVYYWDSFEKIKGQKETLRYFDRKYSFDSIDCKSHNLIKAHNFFHIQEIIQNAKNRFDVCYLGTLDNRYNNLVKISQKLISMGLKLNVTLFCYQKDEKKMNDGFNYINKIIPFDESHFFSKSSNIILDIHHENQTGVSFRPYEAMGLKKKLISTNRALVNYDFYHPDNIHIIDDIDNFEIPKSFLETPYNQIQPTIYNKYFIKNWVDTFINN